MNFNYTALYWIFIDVLTFLTYVSVALISFWLGYTSGKQSGK